MQYATERSTTMLFAISYSWLSSVGQARRLHKLLLPTQTQHSMDGSVPLAFRLCWVSRRSDGCRERQQLQVIVSKNPELLISLFNSVTVVLTLTIFSSVFLIIFFFYFSSRSLQSSGVFLQTNTTDNLQSCAEDRLPIWLFTTIVLKDI